MVVAIILFVYYKTQIMEIIAPELNALLLPSILLENFPISQLDIRWVISRS